MTDLQDQPPPVVTDGAIDVTATLLAHLRDSRAPQRLIDEVEHRRAVGLERYGQPLLTLDGRDVRVDAAQEALDLLAYAMRAYLEGHATRADVDDAQRVAVRWLSKVPRNPAPAPAG